MIINFFFPKEMISIYRKESYKTRARYIELLHYVFYITAIDFTEFNRGRESVAGACRFRCDTADRPTAVSFPSFRLTHVLRTFRCYRTPTPIVTPSAIRNVITRTIKNTSEIDCRTVSVIN